MDKKLAQQKLSAYRLKNKLKNNALKKDLNNIHEQYNNLVITEKELPSFLNKVYYVIYNDEMSSEGLDIFKNTLISCEFLNCFCFNNKEKLYYIGNNPNILLNALSEKYINAFFSHHTASCIHGFNDPTDSIFMSNLYQSKTSKKGVLNQNAINRIFSGKMRQVKKSTLITNNHLDLENKLYLLSQYADISKYTLDDLGIIQKQVNKSHILISSFERLLIESVVRPSYFPNLKSIIDIYIKAEKYIDFNKLFKILDSLNYTYPYHQSIGFLLEITNYSQQQVSLFQNLPINFDFYLIYNSSKYDLQYSEKWHLFYPKDALKYV